MRGHIRAKGKQSWQIQIYTGNGPDGKPAALLRDCERAQG